MPTKKLVKQTRHEFKAGKHVTLKEVEKKLKGKQWEPRRDDPVYSLTIAGDCVYIYVFQFSGGDRPVNLFKTYAAAEWAAREVKKLLKSLPKE